MRFVFALSCALTLIAPVAAQEDQPIAIDELQCVHLVDLSGEELSFLLAWLDGYFNHMHGTATLSDQNLLSLGGMIENGCAADPQRGVLAMLEERIRQDALNLHP